MLALRVAAVAIGEVREDLLDGPAALGGASAGAFLVIRNEEHLQGRVGADDGADVPALRHVGPPGDQVALAHDHGLPHAGMNGHA